jgi:hypothetical protein
VAARNPPNYRAANEQTQTMSFASSVLSIHGKTSIRQVSVLRISARRFGSASRRRFALAARVSADSRCCANQVEWFADVVGFGSGGRSLADPGDGAGSSAKRGKALSAGQSSADRRCGAAVGPARSGGDRALGPAAGDALEAIGIGHNRIPAPSVWRELFQGSEYRRLGTGPRAVGCWVNNWPDTRPLTANGCAAAPPRSPLAFICWPRSARHCKARSARCGSRPKQRDHRGASIAEDAEPRWRDHHR